MPRPVTRLREAAEQEKEERDTSRQRERGRDRAERRRKRQAGEKEADPDDGKSEATKTQEALDRNRALIKAITVLQQSNKWDRAQRALEMLSDGVERLLHRAEADSAGGASAADHNAAEGSA